MKIVHRAALRRLAWGSLLVAALIGSPAAYSEVVSQNLEDSGTLLGNYLSGRLARGDHDTLAAAGFYSKALAEDPSNEIILEQAFLLEAASAHWDRAVQLAKDLVKAEPTHRIARFLLGCEAFKQGNFEEADEHFAAARQGPIADLTSTLARAWVQEADGKPDEAFATLDSLSDADWAQFYQRYHRALIADLAGKQDVARQAFAAAFKKNPSTLRVADAYARHAVNSNNRKLARQTLKNHIAKSSGHPLSEALLSEIEEGKTPPLLVTTPNDGLAEVFYGIGDALAGEGGLDMGIIFLQFSLYLKPDAPLAYAALAEAYESAKKYELEIQALDQIKPDSPLWPNAQIQKAFALNSMERVDDAKVLLEELVAKDPKDVRPLDALGNILRSHERYAEARDYYSRALKLIPKPTKENWTLFYSRGVCNERTKDWPAAEADFKQALALAPEESLILNYLGYSWVDQGHNLKQAMDYIRKAVKLKPDDGYYVDSLGWAYYRLGNLPAAVENLERAVELKPDDPIINDHLGDAYWKVGRTLEAKYQWSQALTLKPEDEQVVTLKQKIAGGLPDSTQTKSAQDRTTQAAGQKTPQ
ncbi:MAG TPA: tetratricopeptide repeat protein [Methyloceanibacter sp.]|jgi:tetratricopeptide (TPR) repeat protein|nr:tetratricopeptide repeat protein [Methyloceanibacter sp.]